MPSNCIFYFCHQYNAQHFLLKCFWQGKWFSFHWICAWHPQSEGYRRHKGCSSRLLSAAQPKVAKQLHHGPAFPGFVLLVPALCFTLFTKSALFMAMETLAAAEHSSVLTILETEAQKSWKLGGKTEQGSEHLPYFSCICLPLLLMWSYWRKKVKASPEAANLFGLSVVV